MAIREIGTPRRVQACQQAAHDFGEPDNAGRRPRLLGRRQRRVEHRARDFRAVLGLVVVRGVFAGIRHAEHLTGRQRRPGLDDDLLAGDLAVAFRHQKFGRENALFLHNRHGLPLLMGRQSYFPPLRRAA